MWDNYRFNDRVKIKCPRCAKIGTPAIRWVKSRDKTYDPCQSKYYHLYIGHYDAEKYSLQMISYKTHARKSRPNGRTWCFLKENTDYLVRCLSPDIWLLIRDDTIRGFRKVVTLEEVEDEEN